MTAVAGAGPQQWGTVARMREVVAASHRRSAELLGSPERAAPEVRHAERELQRRRDAHPLAPVIGVLRRLLVEPATDAGLIVAVTDGDGHLVWVEGDRAARRSAEGMAFVPGADWSEASVGTSAPGTVIATGDEVQVVGAEHYAPAAQGWNCSAVPVRDRASGRLVGAVDVTGGDAAVAPHTLPLLRAAVAAVEAELLTHAPRATSGPPGLGVRLLGRARALLEGPDGRAIELSPRHSELLLLLAAHPDGLTGPELSALLYGDAGSAITLRAELARLRGVLAQLDPRIRLRSRPYRLDRPLRTDADDVLRAIGRGAHRQALRQYAGAPLPGSVAPGVEAYRDHTCATLRGAVLGDGGLDAVLHFLELPGHADDVDANLLALRLLPPRSPKRAGIVARLEALEA